MVKQIILILILSLFVVACNGNQPKKPDNLISKAKMQAVLYDLYIVSAAKGVNRKLLEKNNVVPEAYLLKKHNIDSLQFAQSNTYYAFKTEDYKAIVDQVKVRLEKERTTLKALKKEEDSLKNHKKDSLKALKLERNKNLTKLNKDSLKLKKGKKIKRLFVLDSVKK